MPVVVLGIGSAGFDEPIYGGAIIFAACGFLLGHSIYVNDHLETGSIARLLFYLCLVGVAVSLAAPALSIGT